LLLPSRIPVPDCAGLAGLRRRPQGTPASRASFACRQQRAFQLEGQLPRVAADGQLSVCPGVVRRSLGGGYLLMLALGDAVADRPWRFA